MTRERLNPWISNLILFCGIIVLDYWLMTWMEPTDFQRAGSVGVLIAIFTFGFYLKIFSKQRLEVSRLKTISAFVDQMGFSEMQDRGSLEDTTRKAAELENKIENDERSTAVFEIFLITLSTIQWGYGDLFHCWINGNGWTAC